MAVIGTGASAVQFVPEIARDAARVDVYQRSAPYVLPKADKPYRAVQQAVFGCLPLARKAERLRVFLFSNDWYPALDRANVSLVTEPVERIVPEGVVTAGAHTRPADVLIYGTGFAAGEFLAPMRVTGRGGRSLREAWRDGAQAYLGITVTGFPNFFLLYGPNTNLGGNSIIYMLEGQIRYVLAALRALDAGHLAWMDVRPGAQHQFNAWVQSASRSSVWESGCHNWYTSPSGRNVNNWPTQTFLYRWRLRRFDLSAYRVTPLGHRVREGLGWRR